MTTTEQPPETDAIPPATPRRRRWLWRRPRLRHSESTEVAAEVAEAERLLPLQSRPALYQRLTPGERTANRRSARKVRSALRGEQRNRQLAEVRRNVQARQLHTELADRDHDDTLWLRRAESRRKRLTSPAARLADLYRVYQLLIRALISTALIGMAWGAANVQRVLSTHFGLAMTEPGYWLAFGVEPLVTVPLVVLMAYQAVLAQWGYATTWREQWPLRLTEAGLLLVAVAINTAPHASAGAEALLYVLPPGMIAVSMIMLPRIAHKLGTILIEARAVSAESADEDASRCTAVGEETLSTGQHAVEDTASDAVANLALTTALTTTTPTGRREQTETVSPSSTGPQSVSESVSFLPGLDSMAATDSFGETAHPQVSGRSTVGQQQTSDRSTPERSGDIETSADRNAVDAPAPRSAEQTVELTDTDVVEQLLEPVAQKLALNNDWLSRQDVMRLAGSGAGRSARLLVTLNERHDHTPTPQPRRRPERDLEIDDALGRTSVSAAR